MSVAVEPRRAGDELRRGRRGGARRARARRPSRCGQRRTSAPVAPAWSRWMCVSRIACGTRSPSAATSGVLAGLRARGRRGRRRSRWQQMTFGRPRCRTSSCSSGGVVTGARRGCRGTAFVSSCGVHDPCRMPTVLKPASATRSRSHSSSIAYVSSPPWSPGGPGCAVVRGERDRRGAGLQGRAGVRVEQVGGREQPALVDEHPARLVQPRGDGLGRQMREDVVQDDDVEGLVLERQHEVGHRQVLGELEVEVGPVAVGGLAPLDRDGVVVVADVPGARAEVAVQRAGEHAGAAADLEHALVGPHEREAAQQAEPGLPDLGVVALADVAQPARGRVRVMAPQDDVEAVGQPLAQVGDETRAHGAGPYNPGMSHRLPERDKPVDDAHLRRALRPRRSPTSSTGANLAKGQTGLSIAFDLPTQTGYDPDDELARGEVGKVGVPVAHSGDMAALLDGIPLDEMNTSMTINATAAWLLGALHRHRRGAGRRRRSSSQGTTQNDIIKEYLSRGTYAFPPGPSMRLIADMVAYTVSDVPKWNPINICSYHLQEAGRDAGAGDRLRDEQRDRRARRGQGARPGRRRTGLPARSSAASPSSSTPASASSRSTRSCARWACSGRSSAASATASRTRSCCASATACRSTRSA